MGIEGTPLGLINSCKDRIRLESWEHLQPTINRIVPLAIDSGLSALSSAEQNTFLVWSYSGAICNGGHASFFFNSYGEYANETVTALTAVGLPEFASLLSRAINLFPNSFVPIEIDERNTAFQNLPEAAHDNMDALDDDFFKFGDGYLMDSLVAYWMRSAGGR
ncbi:MAG: DMP19 family protein [Sphingomonadaceae bacterium]|nr:DMP19 family protein [Sphingomonadaceae bacterium]